MTNQAMLLTVLARMPKKYTPIATLADELIKLRLISVHREYKGKHPRNPRYQGV